MTTDLDQTYQRLLQLKRLIFILEFHGLDPLRMALIQDAPLSLLNSTIDANISKIDESYPFIRRLSDTVSMESYFKYPTATLEKVSSGAKTFAEWRHPYTEFLWRQLLQHLCSGDGYVVEAMHFGPPHIGTEHYVEAAMIKDIILNGDVIRIYAASSAEVVPDDIENESDVTDRYASA